MELGTSDLTAPFTVDQACQGPLKQHKWGLGSLCQSMCTIRKVQRYKGVPATQARLEVPGAQALGAELALGDGRAIGCSGQLTV